MERTYKYNNRKSGKENKHSQIFNDKKVGMSFQYGYDPLQSLYFSNANYILQQNLDWKNEIGYDLRPVAMRRQFVTHIYL